MVKTGSERETDRQVNKHLQTEKIESERERVVVRERSTCEERRDKIQKL